MTSFRSAASKPDGLAVLTSNEYLVLAGTLHGIHAITARLSPTGSSSGAEVIEGETFKMTLKLTPTGMSLDPQAPSHLLKALLTRDKICASYLACRNLR